MIVFPLVLGPVLGTQVFILQARLSHLLLRHHRSLASTNCPGGKGGTAFPSGAHIRQRQSPSAPEKLLSPPARRKCGGREAGCPLPWGVRSRAASRWAELAGSFRVACGNRVISRLCEPGDSTEGLYFPAPARQATALISAPRSPQ